MSTVTSADAARQEAAEAFVSWLERRVVSEGRGDEEPVLEGVRADRFWLGKLGSESAEWKKALGQRGNRLDPCAVGFRFRPAKRRIPVEASCRIWTRQPNTSPVRWVKS